VPFVIIGLRSLVHEVLPGEDLAGAEVLVVPVDSGVDHGDRVVLGGILAQVAIAVATEPEVGACLGRAVERLRGIADGVADRVGLDALDGAGGDEPADLRGCQARRNAVVQEKLALRTDRPTDPRRSRDFRRLLSGLVAHDHVQWLVGGGGGELGGEVIEQPVAVGVRLDRRGGIVGRQFAVQRKRRRSREGKARSEREGCQNGEETKLQALHLDLALQQRGGEAVLQTQSGSSPAPIRQPADVRSFCSRRLRRECGEGRAGRGGKVCTPFSPIPHDSKKV
jgi:hypothetical protein